MYRLGTDAWMEIINDINLHQDRVKFYDILYWYSPSVRIIKHISYERLIKCYSVEIFYITNDACERENKFEKVYTDTYPLNIEILIKMRNIISTKFLIPSLKSKYTIFFHNKIFNFLAISYVINYTSSIYNLSLKKKKKAWVATRPRTNPSNKDTPCTPA